MLRSLVQVLKRTLINLSRLEKSVVHMRAASLAISLCLLLKAFVRDNSWTTRFGEADRRAAGAETLPDIAMIGLVAEWANVCGVRWEGVGLLVVVADRSSLEVGHGLNLWVHVMLWADQTGLVTVPIVRVVRAWSCVAFDVVRARWLGLVILRVRVASSTTTTAIAEGRVTPMASLVLIGASTGLRIVRHFKL
jgi:hypothetical protein